jgi:tetratricopeptide (TPR) repeat protein
MALQTVTQNPESERAKNGYLNMLARHAIETADCSNIYLGESETREGKHTAFVTAAGMCAAIDRDMVTASLASERLKDQEKKAEQAGKSYNALEIKILSKEVDALMRLADGDYNSAIRLAKEAADIELNNMSAPSGPPVPMKPASELYGEMLAAAGKYDEAVIAYKTSLDWVPNRTPSIVGLIAAASGNDDKSLAEEMRTKIRSTPGINLDQFSAFLENSLANNIN